MGTKEVRDAKLLSRREATIAGRAYVLTEVAYQGFAFQPGQFVMIGISGGNLRWAYPYPIQFAANQGFTVAASRKSALFAAQPGDAVVVWGPNGKGLESAGPLTLVAEPATYALVAPLARAHPGSLLRLVGGYVESLDGEIFEPVVVSADQALAAVDATVVAALNPATLRAAIAAGDARTMLNTRVYVATKIGCGIGACKGCNIHAPDIRIGIPVCCNGPFLPLSQLDLDTDGNCLQTFE